MSRYLRHDTIDWFSQAKLRAAHYVVVGAGAVGNEVIKNLCLLGVGRLHIIDFDKIEEHNLTRSVLFGASDIGRYKAEAAAEACRRIDPAVVATWATGDAWDVLSFDSILEAQAVLCCVDNFDARIRLNLLCRGLRRDLVNVGIDSRHVSLELFPHSSDPCCACYECGLPPSVYAGLATRYSCGALRKVQIESNVVATTAVTASAAGALAVSLALQRLNAHPAAMTVATRVFLDAIRGEASSASIPRVDECPGCGPASEFGALLKARRVGAVLALAECTLPDIATVRFSEPVVLTTMCSGCSREQDYFESARRLNDAITMCGQCGSRAVAVHMVEAMGVKTFSDAFRNRRVPSKYITLETAGVRVTIELEE